MAAENAKSSGKKSLLDEIDSQIDYEFIAEKKKNPQEFHEFLKRGEKILALVQALNAIQEGIDAS